MSVLRRSALPLALAGAVVAVVLMVDLVGATDQPPATDGPSTVTVTRGELVVRSVFEGRIQSRRVVSVAAQSQGSSTIVELAPEGAPVRVGDVLVRFDTAEVERELLRHRTDVELRSADLEKLVEGEHPMKLRRIESEAAEVRRTLATEEKYLADSVELAQENLVSEAEVAEQRGKVEGLRQRLANLESDLELTRTHVHPMALRRARATLAAAREELARAREKLREAAITAPSSGVVVYQPLHLSGEYRAVRVGDSVYSNQPFLQILDFRDLVVEIAVPEAELGAVTVGNPVMIQPTAFPEVRLAGAVEKVGAVAQTLPGRPAWQRFFRTTIGVDEQHARLRPGMSAVAHVVTHQSADALRVPRRSVRFLDGRPVVSVVENGDVRDRVLRLGAASEGHFEVLDGLAEGDVVRVP